MASTFNNFVGMKVVLIEPFYTSSHKSWADGIVNHSKHDIQLLSLPGRHWKWRMHGAAVSFADQVNEMQQPPELIMVSDMMDVAVFRGLLKTALQRLPLIIYMHENQITYPWSSDDPDIKLQRDNHYGWINYTSALSADRIIFNSEYHLSSFTQSLPKFLGQFPDKSDSEKLRHIADKSEVIGVGLELDEGSIPKIPALPTFLWNHRWEFDKNPDSFFKLLFRLKSEGFEFKLVVIGESYGKQPPIFEEAQIKLANEIIQWGFVENGEDYKKLLNTKMIYPVTSNQDFFGISCLEAIYYGAYPILPNRLAFPEHFKSLDAAHHFYNTDEDLYAKVNTILQSKSWMSDTGLMSAIEKYKWKSIIECYDECFLLTVKAEIPNKVTNIAALKT